MALTSEWLSAHADDFDVLHVHFGLESFTAAELQASLQTARRLGRPVVYTVHDLENPQMVDQTPYLALLDTMIPGADHLLTLTPGAAAEIVARWGRESRVVPHPTLLGDSTGEGGDPAERVARGERDAPGADATIRVGIHLRDLRPNIAAEKAVAAAVETAELLAESGCTVVFDILLNARDRDTAQAARIVDAASAHPSVSLRRTERLSDAAVEAWIAGLDLFVLPYRHGTHSGWVELCYDLGVPVAGTAVGHIADQHPAEFSTIDLDDAHTLAAAVRRAHDARESRTTRATRLSQRRIERLTQREDVRAVHAAVYAEARVRS